MFLSYFVLTHLSRIGYNSTQPLGILLRKVFYHEQEPLPAGRSRPPRLRCRHLRNRRRPWSCRLLRHQRRGRQGFRRRLLQELQGYRSFRHARRQAFDKLVDNGPKADDDAIAASTWATAVKDAGVFKIGGVQTSTLFSLLNEKDGQTRGFDAGIAQLLSNYILGENKVEITQVTSDTRESVLQNGQVDAVFATYTITDERKKLVSFAGPYYYTQQAILVLADNDDIKSVDDLADKNVAVQSGSNGPAILEEFAPKASQQEFKTDEEARQALQQGRVDAYVIDNNMQQSALVREPGKYKIAGKPFGSKEPYGIGLPLDSDGVAFVNDFLKKIEDDGTWTELWQICIGDRTGDTNVPELPEIGA